MKIITVSEFETNFDNIMDDVTYNKQFYRIQTEEGDVMLIPYESYEVLQNIYQDWVEDTKDTLKDEFDHLPIPAEYIKHVETEI